MHGTGVDDLIQLLRERAAALLPRENELALNQRQRDLLAECAAALRMADATADLLLIAEANRLARAALDRLTGRAGVEDMLDSLFGTFCIGK
jgi:tRNA modification GTPase